MHLSAMCCVICCIHHGVVSVFPLQGGIEAIVTGCKALVDLVIGDRNGVGRGGARAIAEHCTGLHTLSLGSNNIIGEEGVRVLVERCPALTALTLGDKTGVGEGGARAIVEYGRALVGLSIGNSGSLLGFLSFSSPSECFRVFSPSWLRTSSSVPPPSSPKSVGAWLCSPF